MNIKSIELTNIKGIGNKNFVLDLTPNRPSILVATNGFGKSSLAIGFDSLKPSKLELGDQNLYMNNAANRPKLEIKLTTGQNLIADDTQNAISKLFDVFVINNQTYPKAVVQSFGGKSFAKTHSEIQETTLISTIPPPVGFAYNSAAMKAHFGANGNKLLVNIAGLLQNATLICRIADEIDFKKFYGARFTQSLQNTIVAINQVPATGAVIKDWMTANIVPTLQGLSEFEKLAQLISEFHLQELPHLTDAYMTAWQILALHKNMGADFNKACKYAQYQQDKKYLTDTIAATNPVKSRFDIKPKEIKNSLVIQWPKAHEMSNGQRDILTFVALLLQARRVLRKENCILIIDEIFDYLDDGNLVTFQYYISTLIDDIKHQKRRIYPILLTHLDPQYFNHFCFSDKSINVRYLQDVNIRVSPELVKFVSKRSDTSIQAHVDKHYFHYHPTPGALNLSAQFAALHLNSAWSTPAAFRKKIDRERRRYLFETAPFDPIALCFAVRLRVEELAYSRLQTPEQQNSFLNENGTKNKLQYVESIGIKLPDVYFLLGIVYNNPLHLTGSYDISKPLGLKLSNGMIKEMIFKLYQ